MCGELLAALRDKTCPPPHTHTETHIGIGFRTQIKCSSPSAEDHPCADVWNQTNSCSWYVEAAPVHGAQRVFGLWSSKLRSGQAFRLIVELEDKARIQGRRSLFYTEQPHWGLAGELM